MSQRGGSEASSIPVPVGERLPEEDCVSITRICAMRARAIVGMTNDVGFRCTIEGNTGSPANRIDLMAILFCAYDCPSYFLRTIVVQWDIRFMVPLNFHVTRYTAVL